MKSNHSLCHVTSTCSVKAGHAAGGNSWNVLPQSAIGHHCRWFKCNAQPLAQFVVYCEASMFFPVQALYPVSIQYCFTNYYSLTFGGIGLNLPTRSLYLHRTTQYRTRVHFLDNVTQKKSACTGQNNTQEVCIFTGQHNTKRTCIRTEQRNVKKKKFEFSQDNTKQNKSIPGQPNTEKVSTCTGQHNTKKTLYPHKTTQQNTGL